MKSLIRFVVALIFASSLSLVSSCKKSDDKSSGATLVAKWNLSSIKFRSVITGVKDTTENIPVSATDYLDFRADGKLYINLSAFSSIDTDAYVISGNKVITGDTLNGDKPDTFTIQNLTASSVALYLKQVDTAGFNEQTLSLSR